jgi:hypothetical protein
MASVVIKRDEAMCLYATDLNGITKPASRFSMLEGLGLVFASLSTVYTCRARGQRPIVSAGYVLPHSEGGTAVRIRADMHTSFSRRGGWHHSLRTVGIG